jgi:hypothetical protein
VLAIASILSGAGALSCGSAAGDPHANDGTPAVGGKDKRIRDVVDPAKDGHADLVKTQQAVSGAIVIAVDKYDETHNGKGTGAVYVQDIGASKETPYAGINLFAPSFNHGNLRVSTGDVLDLRGEYQENTQIPSSPPVVFPPGSVLVQLSQPTATFRYETRVPEPVDIDDIADLASFEKGRKWIGMLVRVKNFKLQGDPFTDTNGRVSVDLLPRSAGAGSKCNDPFGTVDAKGAYPKPPSLVNDLVALEDMGLKASTPIQSITGVVSFFCNIKLAPRSAADIKL